MEAILKMAKMNGAPGPRGMELLRVGKRIQEAPLKMFEYLRDEYGDFVYCGWPTHPSLFIYDPKDIGRILKDNHTNYQKGPEYKEMAPLLGRGLLLSEGELWRKQRQVMAKEFHKARLLEYSPAIQEETERMLDLWHKEGAGIRNLAHDMTDVTFRIATRIFFGITPEADADLVKHSLEDELTRANRRNRRMFNLPRWFPIEENRKGEAAIKYLNGLITPILNGASKHPTQANVLKRLLDANVPQDLVRDEVMTLMLAGHETTSAALTWTLYLLATHPEWQEKIREDQSGQVARMCLKEGMRLYPPAAVVSRVAKEEDVLCGRTVPPGISLVISQWAVHRDERFWEAPTEFRPMRFENGEEGIDDYTYFPFARGPRACIGEELAMIEAETLLRAMVNKFSFGVKDGYVPVPEHYITIRAKGGMHLNVTPR